MTILVKTSVKTYFITGSRPTQSQFGDFIDSALFLAETTSQKIAGSIIVSGSATFSNSINITAGGVTIVSGIAAANIPAITNSGIMLHLAGATQASMQLNSFGGATQIIGGRANGTAASPVKVSATDLLLTIAAGGYDGTAYGYIQARIAMVAETDWDTNDHSTYIKFETTSGASTTLQEAARITGKKNNILSWNGTTGVIATGATDGMPTMPTCAGAKTGTPTAYTGCAQFVYDSTNNKMYIWNPIGSAWKSVQFA